MTVELRMLFWAVLIGLAQMLATGIATTAQRGLSHSASARDDSPGPLEGVGGRVQRAFANFMETFPFFAAAVLAGHALGRHGAATEWGATVYLWARIAYWPLYVAGVPWVRSLVWAASLAGIVLILWGIA